MSSPDVPQLAARIGIDWADTQHEVSLQVTGSDTVERARIAHTPEALTDWLAGLRLRFGGRSVGISLETSRGPLVHALLEHDFIVLYPVNPKSLKDFRKVFATSGAKDDPTDADLLLELLLKHEERLHRWMPDNPETRALARLTRDRRKAVDLRTRLTQQLRDVLKGYFPQALQWTGGDLTRPLAADFLLKWPTLQAVQRARPQTVRKFYYGHNCRRGDLIEARLEAIRSATPLTSDPAIIETSILTVQMLARQIRALGPSIARYDDEIARRFEAHTDAELFSCLPGAGDALAPRLLAAFGTDRDRFRSAVEVQQATGIAPVTERSGQRTWVHWRWSVSTFVRQSFHEFARLSIHRSAWAQAYYELQRERGKGHHAAIRALAFKWIRILFRCWKDRTPYDEDRYLGALRRRGSPLVDRLKAPAPG
jgi:transposase